MDAPSSRTDRSSTDPSSTGPGSTGPLLTGREATRVLVAAGHTTRMARRLLDAGLAGEPVRTPAAQLYEAAAVVALAERPTMGPGDVDAACPLGVFLARRLDHVPGPWDFCVWTAVRLRVHIEEHGAYPLVVALAGVVVDGSDIIAVRRDAGGYLLDLRQPGDWFDAFRGRRCPTGPGRPWAVHLPRQPRVGGSAA